MTQERASAPWATGEVLRFGPFHLIPGERRLERDGLAVKIGDRALDILLCLVAATPEVISKELLIRQVWPNLIVEEGNLRFQIASLRQVLAEGSAGGQQFVATVQGKGYAFVAPVSRVQAPGLESDAERESGQRLPMRSARTIGRDREVAELSEKLMANRLLSVVGPGGVGKTTVAVAVAHGLLQTFDGAVRFIDLGALADASLVPRTLASLFGLTVHAPDPVNSLVALLRDQRMLVVLDNCEHVIDAAAGAAEALYLGAPGIYILITSREPLRVEGEVVARIQPLDFPPAGMPMDAATAMQFPATELLIDRLSGTTDEFRLRDEDAPFFSEICRRLDGLPLAIELAAGLVQAYGTEEAFERLGEGVLSAGGHEAEAPRHQTLAAMLDWSYDLLTEPERVVLQRLSTLVGAFPMEAAQAIGSVQKTMRHQAAEIIAGLVAKSLLKVNFYETQSRFRLLDTTRAYALQKLRESGQLQRACRTHAEYFCEVIEEALDSVDPDDAADCDWTEQNIGNVRAALDWCFSADGDRDLGVRLAAGSAAVFLDMSLWDECKDWTARALSALPAEAVGSRREMLLRESFGLASMVTESVKAGHYAELERCLAIAESLGDRHYQLRLIGALVIHHQRLGEMGAALDLARRGAIVAGTIGTREAVTLSDWLLGISNHLTGNHREAIPYGQMATRPFRSDGTSRTIGYGVYEHRIRARCGLARSLWLIGYHREGVEEAEKTIAEAIELEHPVNICIALIWTAQVFLWNEDWSRAEDAIRSLLRYAEKYSFMPYVAYSRSAFAELKIKQGMVSEGVDALRACLAARRFYHVATAPQNCTLAEGLLQLGAIDEGLAQVEAALQSTIERGGSYWLPEILRVKAALQSRSAGHSGDAEATFLQASRIAEEQGALSLVMQIAMSAADHRIGMGAIDEAREVLRSAISRFKRGQDNKFLLAAKDRLTVLEKQDVRRSS